MKKLIVMFAAVGLVALPALAKEAKKPADFVITVSNSSAAALTEFNLTEVVPAAPVASAPKSNDWWMAPVNMVSSWTAPAQPAPTTRVVNLLKKPIPAKKSASVTLGKACNVTISAVFGDGSTVDATPMDLCKDKKLNIGG
jgi:hypothetical protein